MFSSCTFFLTDGVADVNAPSLGEIQSIVESGGGTWIHGTEAFIEFCRIRHTNYQQSFSSATATAATSSSSSSSSSTSTSSSTTKSTKKKNAKSLECESQSLESDNNKNIVILSTEAAYVSLGVHVRTAITSALQSQWVMGDGIYSLEVLFLAVLRQQLTFQSCNLLQSFQTSNSNSQSSDNIEDKKKGNSKIKKAK